MKSLLNALSVVKRGVVCKSLKNHMRKHATKNKENKCDKCKKCFGAKRNMKRHVKNVHRGHNDTSRNSNGSNVDGNLNTDPLLPAM